MRKMNPKRQRFADEYLKDLNATQAAIRAGYSKRTAHQQGYVLLKNPDVAAAVADGQRRRSASTALTTDRVLLEIARLALFDPRKLYGPDGLPLPIHELDDDTAAAVAGLEVLQEFVGTGKKRRQVSKTLKVRLADKGGALALAARHLGLTRERIEHTGANGVPLPTAAVAVAPVINIFPPGALPESEG